MFDDDGVEWKRLPRRGSLPGDLSEGMHAPCTIDFIGGPLDGFPLSVPRWLLRPEYWVKLPLHPAPQVLFKPWAGMEPFHRYKMLGTTSSGSTVYTSEDFIDDQRLWFTMGYW